MQYWRQLRKPGENIQGYKMGYQLANQPKRYTEAQPVKPANAGLLVMDR